jgi:hypothetical protein
VTCRQVANALGDLHDGRLGAPEQVRLHDHLEGCAACRARAELWGQLTPALRATEPPPLDEMRLRRLEVAVERGRLVGAGAAEARLARPRRARVVGFAAALAVSAAVALFVRPRSGPGAAALRAELTSARAASIVTADGVARPLEPGARLGAGQTVSVAAGGEAAMALDPGTTIGLHGPARLTLRGTRAALELALDEGVLDAVVAHRQPNESFVVRARGARVVVRGTRFRVAAGDPAWVRVDEGRVAVVGPDGVERAVSAGETLALSAPSAPPAADERPTAQSPAAPIEPARAAGDCLGPRACDAFARDARLAMRGGSPSRALALLSRASGTRGGDPCPAAGPSCARELGYLEAEALRLDGRLEAAVAAYKRLDQHGAPSATRQNALDAAAELVRGLGRRARRLRARPRRGAGRRARGRGARRRDGERRRAR